MHPSIHLPHLARAFYLEPLALEEATMLACHMVLWPRITGQSTDHGITVEAASPTDTKRSGFAAHSRRTLAMPLSDGSGNILDPNYFWTVDGKPQVAVIPINGIIMQGAGGFQEACMGAVSTERIAHALNQAAASPAISQIVLDIASPGGRTVGMPELASFVAQIAAMPGKTVYAFTDSQIASAATWIASQCNEVYLTGSASIGSIGTYLAFLNPAIAMKMQGYSMEIFSQGTHKGLGVPGREITQADRAYLQKTVDDLNAQFVAAVKSGRADVSEDAITSAKMYPGRDAVSQGLADGIVSGWDEMISLL